MSGTAFVGAWQLKVYELRYNTRETVLPMGENPSGLLMYDSSGYMSVHLTRPDRVPFASDEYGGGTPAEKVTAYESYRAYFGRYTVDKEAGTVTHHVINGTHPNMANTDRVRHFSFDDDLLTLKTPPIATVDGPRWAYLVWQRVGSVTTTS